MKRTKDETPTGAFCTDKLCDRDAGYGTLQCSYENTKGSCPGATGNYCWSYHVWSGEGGQYHLVNGIFKVTNGGVAHAFSVRCVLDLLIVTPRKPMHVCHTVTIGNIVL